MIPLRLLQSLYGPLRVCRESAITLWPATQLLFGRLEDDMTSMRKDMERTMQRVHQVDHLLAQDMERRAHPTTSSGDTDTKASTARKEAKENFQLTLDVRGFTPEELTVKTEGRRLIVSGKHDKRKEAENGGYFHEYREWRREAELPQDVSPEDILCSLSQDGQLRFQAPRLALPPAEETPIPINVTQSPGGGQQNPLETQNCNPEGGGGLDSS
ncbi:hypothetical protein GDO81_012685 [Engystomops pustulosus]|uniref:SHSP domain-containing protein n=1 Tax=Engystomops pustulosus TaxID=76066 RepID=A0AAV7B0I9_ENGPU|nr:hypothetical protein GDO81_012685 [Engystomops pustulosus]